MVWERPRLTKTPFPKTQFNLVVSHKPQCNPSPQTLCSGSFTNWLAPHLIISTLYLPYWHLATVSVYSRSFRIIWRAKSRIEFPSIAGHLTGCQMGWSSLPLQVAKNTRSHFEVEILSKREIIPYSSKNHGRLHWQTLSSYNDTELRTFFFTSKHLALIFFDYRRELEALSLSM